MTGKTHMTAGIAASLAAVMPGTPKEMLICVGAAAVGGVISDIDVSTSEARRDFNKLLGVAFVILLAAVSLEYSFQFGIYRMIRQHGYLELIAGMVLFFAVCIFGKTQPHRSFTHSFLGLALLTGSVYLMLPAAAVPFAAAMASHMALDLLNKKKVKLFYPYHKGVALSLCRSDGAVNGFFFYAALVLDVVIVGWILVRYFVLKS
jgi:inner membrane protein